MGETKDGQLLVIIRLSKRNVKVQAGATRLEQWVTCVQNSGAATDVLKRQAAAAVLERQADAGAFDCLLIKLALRDIRLLFRELIRQRDGKGLGTPKCDIDQTC